MARTLNPLLRALFAAAFALLAGCSLNSAPSSDTAGALPALPAGLFDSRRPAQIQISHLNGDDAISYSSSAVTVGSALQLTAPAGPSLEWAIWRLTPSPGAVPKSASVSLDLTTGSNAWIGIADYESGTWKLHGPYAQDGAPGIAPLSPVHISPGGNIYVLVCAHDGTQLSVTGVDIELDVPAPPKFFITGTLKDSYQDIGFIGQVVTLTPGGAQSTTDSTGDFTFVNLNPGTYTVTAPAINGYDLATPSMQVDLTTTDFTAAHFAYTPQTSDITYTSHIKVLLDARCVSCHNGTDPARKRLDSYIRPDSDDVFHNIEESLMLVQGDVEPQGGPALLPNQKQMLADWINIYNKAE